MKKIICIVLCLIMVAAAFAGCSKKPKTYQEAAAAGKEFMESAGLKNIKSVTELTGVDELKGAKVIVEGTYDPKAEKGVFSIGFDMDNLSFTLKDEVILNGRKVYIKVPDQSTLERLVGSFAVTPDVYEPTVDYNYDYTSATSIYEALYGDAGETDLAEGIYTIGSLDGDELVWEEWDGPDLKDIDLGELGLSEDLLTIGADDYDFYGHDAESDVGSSLSSVLGEILGKYIMIQLPEEGQLKTIKGIIDDAEQSVYEKAEKLEAEENYPYVVKYNLRSAYDLFISVMDGIKGKKSDIAKELSALAEWYLGTEIFKDMEQSIGDSLANMLVDELDKFFENTDIPDYEEVEKQQTGKFEIIQKIAYENNKKFEYVVTTVIDDVDESISSKTTCTVTAADKDAEFESRCTVSEDDTYDVFNELKKMYNSLVSKSPDMYF